MSQATKHPKPQNVPTLKHPNPKTSQPQKVPSPSTTQLHNVPSHKMSQASKHPKPQNYRFANFFYNNRQLLLIAVMIYTVYNNKKPK
jgi:hypothetical protein